MIEFQVIEATALARKGAETLAARMPQPHSDEALKSVSDPSYFSLMSFRIFSAGLKQSMVRNKWPAFEEAFVDFIPAKVAFFADDDLDRLMGDRRLIRHGGKMRAILHNAGAFTRLAEEHGSFGAYLTNWSGDNAVGLWEDLGKRFKQLGGNSAAYFLRWAGWDTWSMSKDVVRALSHWEDLEDPGKSKRAKRAAQEHFNRWAEESGGPFSHISMTLALSID